MRILKDRRVIFLIIIIIIGIIFGARLISLQIVHGASYEDAAYKKLLENNGIKARRGDILDRNGSVIATSRTGYSVKLSWVNMSNDKKNDMFYKLIDILERHGDTYQNYISDYLTFNPINFGPKLKENPEALAEWKKTIWDGKTNMYNINTPQELFDYLKNTEYQISNTFTDEQIYKIISLKYGISIYSYYNINPFADDISRESVAEITERKGELPSVEIVTSWYRVYNGSEYISHVLGYVGRISGEELKANAADGYLMNDIIGKDGVELSMEKYLRGQDGYNIVQRNESGEIVNKYVGKNAVPGKDVVLDIDMNLQKVATASLKKAIETRKNANEPDNFKDANAGAVVVMDVNTGEILAMASYPSYDPAIFLQNTPEANLLKAQWQSDNTNIPLYNRAIGGIYAPGSTFKPITAISALQAGTLDPYALFIDMGALIIDGKRFENFGGIAYGAINLNRAFAISSNSYFGTAGMNVGIDAIDSWAKKFGVGEKTGIQLPGEMSGIRSNMDTKWQLYQETWGRMDTAQTAVGQFISAFTPLQMARYVTALANQGHVFTPLIIRNIVNPDGSVFDTEETKVKYTEVDADPKNFDLVKQGMIQVMKQGAFIETPFAKLGFDVAGKTGTAETGQLNASWNSIFISYAPADKPQIAVAVIIEHGVQGYYNATVAGDIYNEYFKVNDIPGINVEVVSSTAVFTR